MKKKLFFIFLVLLFLIPCYILSSADNSVSNTTNTNKTLFQFAGPSKEVDSPGYFGMFIKTILILGLFGIGIYYIFKYISKKQGLSFPHINVIKIITSLPVGTNRFIQLIEIGNKYYLIGSTENQINLLTEITDKETVDRILMLKNKPGEQTQTFTFIQFLNDLFGGVTKKFKTKDGSFLKKQKERLRNLHIPKKM